MGEKREQIKKRMEEFEEKQRQKKGKNKILEQLEKSMGDSEKMKKEENKSNQQMTKKINKTRNKQKNKKNQQKWSNSTNIPNHLTKPAEYLEWLHNKILVNSQSNFSKKLKRELKGAKSD